MNAAAAACMEEFKDIVLAYGQSDEYRSVAHASAASSSRPQCSFVLRPETALFTRRSRLSMLQC